MPWWERPGLEVRDGRLLVAGWDAETLARERGTPAFAYDLVRVEEQARSLLDAFERAGVPLRLRLALKTQRDPDVLAFVRRLGVVGIDACSPGEVRHALEHGWAAGEISVRRRDRQHQRGRRRVGRGRRAARGERATSWRSRAWAPTG